MNWLFEHWLLLLPLALCGASVAWLLPSAASRPRGVGYLMGGLGLAILAGTVSSLGDSVGNGIVFHFIAGVALISAVMMITNRNPVYAALWFALVTLSTCGLFLLQSAPFLAAATIVVYAGAIIVTFMFVIMLAQQAGNSNYDQHAREPIAATVGAFLLLGCILGVLAPRSGTGIAEDLKTSSQSLVADSSPSATPIAKTHSLSVPTGTEGLASMKGLGRSLFGDYLFAVELGGTLLLIASIGAIVVAPRRA